MKFIFNVPTRLLKGQIWIAVCGIVAAFALSTCGVLRKLADTSSPGYDQIGGLVRDSGFEEESWGISALPGYGEYAEINIDEKIKHKGRRSGHVYLQRHPRGNVRVLHAWTQTYKQCRRARAFDLAAGCAPSAARRFRSACAASSKRRSMASATSAWKPNSPPNLANSSMSKKPWSCLPALPPHCRCTPASATSAKSGSTICSCGF